MLLFVLITLIFSILGLMLCRNSAYTRPMFDGGYSTKGLVLSLIGLVISVPSYLSYENNRAYFDKLYGQYIREYVSYCPFSEHQIEDEKVLHTRSLYDGHGSIYRDTYFECIRGNVVVQSDHIVQHGSLKYPGSGCNYWRKIPTKIDNESFCIGGENLGSTTLESRNLFKITKRISDVEISGYVYKIKYDIGKSFLSWLKEDKPNIYVVNKFTLFNYVFVSLFIKDYVMFSYF